LLPAWRRLAERDPLDKAIRLMLRPTDWMVDLTNALDVPLDAALADVGWPPMASQCTGGCALTLLGAAGEALGFDRHSTPCPGSAACTTN